MVWLNTNNSRAREWDKILILFYSMLVVLFMFNPPAQNPPLKSSSCFLLLAVQELVVVFLDIKKNTNKAQFLLRLFYHGVYASEGGRRGRN